jgi:NAD(P)H dehydrogenase (quinone)
MNFYRKELTVIVVTGAGGQLGRHVIEGLLATVPPSEIVAAVRDPARVEAFANRGVQIRRADYDEPDTLTEAFGMPTGSC